jgi:hypothetical protein
MFFLERLQYGINKGLDNNLVTIEIKNVIEVNPNAMEVKKEIPTTFKITEEVKKVLITFVVKKEVKEFEEIKTMQTKTILNGIPS